MYLIFDILSVLCFGFFSFDNQRVLLCFVRLCDSHTDREARTDGSARLHCVVVVVVYLNQA